MQTRMSSSLSIRSFSRLGSAASTLDFVNLGREVISGSELNSLEIGKMRWIFSHILGLRTANPRPGARAESRALSPDYFRHLEGRKGEKFCSFFSDWSPFDEVDFVLKMGVLHKFWAFPRGRKPEGIKKIFQKGGCLECDMSHFSSENFDFRVLSE